MILSMTGFGKSTIELPGKKITIEIKTLNSKQLDLNVRMPQIYREKEFELRNEISKILVRGKTDLNLNLENVAGERHPVINKEVVINYMLQIKELASELQVDYRDGLLPAVLRLPESLSAEANKLDDKEWDPIFACFKTALQNCHQYRLDEGNALQTDILSHVSQIKILLEQVVFFEKGRIERIRQRIESNLTEFFKAENFDMNRLEQEMIFYLEKLDISEEKQRLKNNLNYFEQTVATDENAGRKLGFIAQEIGREINTLGSKANDSDLQKLVIQMKDELEKIKEQILNIL